MNHLTTKLLLTIAFIFCISGSSAALPRRGFMLDTLSINVAKAQHDVNLIADDGGNLVRFPIYFSTSYCDVGCWLSFAEQVQAVANSRGIVTVLDFHHPGPCPPGSANCSTITDENNFVAKWGLFAQRFANKSRVWYDLLNEPANSDWSRIALRAAQTIRAHDSHNAIVYAARGSTTSQASSSTFRPLPGISNQIVEFHFWDWWPTVQFYDPSVSSRYRYVGSAGSASSTAYTLAQLQAKLENVRRFGATHGVPVYIGEVGINRSHRDAARFLRDFTTECKTKGIHLTVHAFREADVWNYELNQDAWRILTSWLRG
ncbi:MAG: cellulase family glycosylhydrolase [Chloracidobacterium sp.]|nr:cellulase family glycosylhydrolase [Chloracidobacterium sp.]